MGMGVGDPAKFLSARMTGVHGSSYMGSRQSIAFLPLDEPVTSRAVFVIVSGSDGRTETLLEPAK